MGQKEMRGDNKSFSVPPLDPRALPGPQRGEDWPQTPGGVKSGLLGSPEHPACAWAGGRGQGQALTLRSGLRSSEPCWGPLAIRRGPRYLVLEVVPG